MIPDRLPLARRVRRLFWPVPIAREIADELAAHLELQTRRYMAAGMSEADARAAALERFGDVDRVSSECRDIRTDMETDMRHAELWQELRTDVGYSLRTLRRSPLFAVVAIVTIGLAIGANTAIFSALNAVLFRPLPYRFADRAEMIWNSNSQSALSRTAVAVPEYFDLKEQLRSHDAVAAVAPQPSPLTGDGGEPERVMAYVVSPNLFDLLGAAPRIGRAFGGDDGTAGAARVIVLAHSFWMRRFGGDPSVLGRTVTVGGYPRTIVGVMPAAVRFPDAPLDFLVETADLWIPSTWEQSRGDSRGNQIIAVVARRTVGVSAAQAAADIDAVSARWRAAYPNRYATAASKSWRLAAIPLRDQMVGSARTSLLVIAAAVAFVLLIACVNVANLLLARGASRQRELSIRLALGAGRARLARQLLTESVVLAGTGGALGLMLAWAGMRALVRLDAGALPRMADAGIDGTVLAVHRRDLDRHRPARRRRACAATVLTRRPERTRRERSGHQRRSREPSAARGARRRPGRDGARGPRRLGAARANLPRARARESRIRAGERTRAQVQFESRQVQHPVGRHRVLRPARHESGVGAGCE